MAARTKEVRLMFSQEEYDFLKNQADKLHMPVAAYVRGMAQNGHIVVKNYRAVERHSRAIAEIRNAINRLVFTIDATNNYLPREIETIVNLMNEIFASENELLKAIRLDQTE